MRGCKMDDDDDDVLECESKVGLDMRADISLSYTYLPTPVSTAF
jgi:hypothetical protein